MVWHLLSEKLADRGGDLLGVGLQGEVTGIDEADVGVGDVALEGLGPGRQEKRVVPAPHREQRRPAGAEVLLECRVERDIARVVEEQVELDFIGAAAGEIVVCGCMNIRIASRLAFDGSFQYAWTGFQPSPSPSSYALPFWEMIAVMRSGCRVAIRNPTGAP